MKKKIPLTVLSKVIYRVAIEDSSYKDQSCFCFSNFYIGRSFQSCIPGNLDFTDEHSRTLFPQNDEIIGY